MDSSHVAVATITWARSGSEEALLTRSLGVLATTGLPVAIADRGTNTNFAEELKGLPGVSVTTPTGQGLVNQVQASVALASSVGRPFILYTEPDKELFFETLLTSFVQQAPEQADVGVVLASRSPESFATFPPTQRYTEGVINYLCTERLGAEYSSAASPRAHADWSRLGMAALHVSNGRAGGVQACPHPWELSVPASSARRRRRGAPASDAAIE